MWLCSLVVKCPWRPSEKGAVKRTSSRLLGNDWRLFDEKKKNKENQGHAVLHTAARLGLKRSFYLSLLCSLIFTFPVILERLSGTLSQIRYGQLFFPPSCAVIDALGYSNGSPFSLSSHTEGPKKKRKRLELSQLRV